jgi:hypothetical protein
VTPLTRILACAGVLAAAAPAAADDAFRRLTGRDITARIAGMEFTDDVHWADVFDHSGSLTSYSMGKKTTGTWRVDHDGLCLTRERQEPQCFQVWVAGNAVELRQIGSRFVLDGTLGKPRQRRL